MKRSSELIESSAPGHSRGVGRPPTAMINCRAVSVCTAPLLSVHSISFGLTNFPASISIKILSKSEGKEEAKSNMTFQSHELLKMGSVCSSPSEFR